MRHVPNIFVIALAVAVLESDSLVPAQTPTYTVVDLGTLGGPESYAYSINSFGQVAGYAETPELTSDGWNVGHAFLWLPKAAFGLPAGMRDLGTLGGEGSGATDLNDSGRVVGESDLPDDGVHGLDDFHAFSWHSGSMIDLGTSDSNLWGSGASAINNLGQAVGWTTTGFAPIPLLWLPTTAYGLPAGLNNLSAVGLQIETSLRDINSFGAMVGALHAIDIVGAMRAFVWLPSAAYNLPAGSTQLVFDESYDSEAVAINESGQIVGYRPVLLSDPPRLRQDGFLWENGIFSTLPTLGGEYAEPTGMNNFGEIIGYCAIDETTVTECLWKDGNVTDLKQAIPPNSEIELWNARGINDVGQIVGYARLLSDGAFYAVLLNPVCPHLLPPYPEPEGIVKNRYLSVGIAFTGPQAAIKVTLVDLPGFPSHNGEVRWVGPPTTYTDSPNSSLIFSAASLQCSPYFADWGGLVPLHVFGAEVVPGSTYRIEIVRQPCPGSATGDPETSLPTTVTTAKWGDIVSPFGAGQPNFGDITSLVGAFQGSPTAPSRVRAQLRPNVPNPTATTNFQDVSQCVEAFKGKPYPFAGPASCPP